MKLKLYHHFITIMKRLFFLITLLSVFELGLSAQNAGRAKQILDQTSAVLSNKGGASAQFTITTPGVGTTTGQITIKGNKFTATTPKAAIWYDGKTQWTYMSKTEEVNVSNPDESQQAQMNPYKFITLYKNGYRLGMKETNGGYEIHLTALNRGRSIQEMFITINKSYIPTNVRLKEGKQWSTITISNYKSSNVDDRVFTFPSKDYPNAELIDLR